MSVLEDINAANKPIVRVLNTVDLLNPLDADRLRFEVSTGRIPEPYTVAVSAATGDGIADLVCVVEEALAASLLVPVELVIPYDKGDELNAVHEQGNVEVVDYRENGTFLRALVPHAIANRLQQYQTVVDQSRPLTAASPASTTAVADEIDWVALGRGRHKKTGQPQ
jgi:GTPase